MAKYEVRLKNTKQWFDVPADNILQAKLAFCEMFNMKYDLGAPLIEVRLEGDGNAE